jgi:hypothetical protein
LPEAVTVDNQEWKEDDDLVGFRACGSPLEAGLIRGVLESNDIPCFVSDGDYYGRTVTLKVPASRVKDAECALEEARRLGEQMPGDP